MQPWVVIQNSSGVALGAGEITSVYDVETTRKLSRAGTFSFSCPINDPLLTEIAPDSRPVLSEKRIALIYGVVLLEGGLTEIQVLGGGVIDRISRTAPDAVVVSGDDLLRELTYRSVLGLQNYEVQEYSATQVKLEDNTTPPPVYTDYPLAHDNNLATFNSVTVDSATNKYLLIAYSTPFNYLRLDVAGTVNTTATTINYGFSDESADGWDEIEPTADGTEAAGIPWSQDGIIEFGFRPASWAERTIDGDTGYWIRCDPEAALTQTDMVEWYVGRRDPTTNDLTNIMAFAPAGWSLDVVDGYSSTTNGTFQRFSDQNVLEALIETADISGEHFRLGDGRSVVWLRKDTPNSGIRAVQITDPTADPAEVCYIENLEEEIVSYELATRIYGRGGGMANEVIDFSDRTTADPANYTTGVESVVQSDGTTDEYWYIESDLSLVIYGRIETFLYNKSVIAADGYGGRDASASDALWTQCLEWLRKHDTPQYFYRLSVVGCQVELKVGETIKVEYKRVVEIDGVNVVTWEIDTDLVILETTNRVGSNGLYTSNLVVSTVAAWWQNDGDTVADARRQILDFHNANQGIAGLNIR